MTRDELNQLDAACAVEESRLRSGRGASYQATDDVLSNFKDAAASLGVTPEQACGLYLTKHLRCLFSFIRSGATSSDEPIEGRIHDARNYLLFLLALVNDRKKSS